MDRRVTPLTTTTATAASAATARRTGAITATRRAALASVAALPLTGLLRPTRAEAATVRLDALTVLLRTGTRQVVTVNRTSSVGARVAFWSLADGRWEVDFLSNHGRIGYGGLVSPGRRKQGTGTTPAGTYGIPLTFGRWNKPAPWRMEYVKMAVGDYWVLDNESRYYNRFRRRSSGGFRWQLRSGINASEHLLDYASQYEMAAALDFNYAEQVRYRGGAIFLHVHGSGATAGCVSVPRHMMEATMYALDPRAVPLVTIGE